MLKKFFIMFFSVICIINMYINIYAYDNINISDVKLYINNELYKFNKKPININGYTYINIDDVKKIFGYDYHIEEDNLILNYSEQGNVINIDNLNSEIICLNLYIENALLGEAYIYNNTIYVPVRLVANRNKCDIYWDIGENSINLNYNISDVFGREIIKTIVYYSKNGIDYDYMFAIYNNQIDASKSVLMIKYFGVFNYEFSDVKDLFGSIDIDDIVDRKIIDIDDKEYSELIEKINNLLNDELKGNDSTEGYDLPRCDYDCHIIEGNDNYQSAFVRVPEIKTTEHYDELKEYLKILSGYEIKYTPTPAHIVIGDYKFN